MEEKATGKRKRGRKPKEPDPSVDPDRGANPTDPDSGIMKTRRGWVHGYNAQAVVTPDQIILAARRDDRGERCPPAHWHAQPGAGERRGGDGRGRGARRRGGGRRLLVGGQCGKPDRRLDTNSSPGRAARDRRTLGTGLSR